MPDLRFEFYELPRNNILDVMRMWNSIDFDPIYQRKPGAWNDDRRKFFIDSIINGVDLSKLYFHELSQMSSSQYVYGVIDGKQRLDAIKRFITDELPLATDFEFMHGPAEGAGGMTYSELLVSFPLLRARFDDAKLPVVVMRTDDEGLIEGLFLRLNEGVALNAPEKRNAFGGPIPVVIRDLIRHTFFTLKLPYDDNRYSHRDLAAKFLWITEQGKFVSTKKNDLDTFVRTFRDGNVPKSSIEQLTQEASRVLDLMAVFFIDRDPLLSGVGWSTLFFHLFRLLSPEGIPSDLSRGAFLEFVRQVTDTRHQVRAIADGMQASGPINPELAQFDSLRQSPNDASALRTRYSILRRYLGEQLLPAPGP